MADRLIRITTALAVAAVAVVAGVISYRHAYELMRSHGETGATARIEQFTVDGLILAASMVILDTNQRRRDVPALAKWGLGRGIVATIGANVVHGLSHGTIGALVSAWPAVALVGSFELLMMLTRSAASPTRATVPPRPGNPDWNRRKWHVPKRCRLPRRRYSSTTWQASTVQADRFRNGSSPASTALTGAR
jgi:hypothetical protein